jgi:hypothetical protein
LPQVLHPRVALTVVDRLFYARAGAAEVHDTSCRDSLGHCVVLRPARTIRPK